MAAKAAVKKIPTKKVAKKSPTKKSAARPPAAKAVAVAGDDGVLDDIRLTVSVELGRSRKSLDDALGIGEQSLIELDKQVGDPVDILLNGVLYARGEVVTVSENFGVRIVEIVGEV